jgi:hypothetical protein
MGLEREELWNLNSVFGIMEYQDCSLEHVKASVSHDVATHNHVIDLDIRHSDALKVSKFGILK